MNQTGQAIVEYIIMLLVAVSIVAVISSSFRTSIAGLWSYYTQQVSAACPTGCPVNTSYRIR